MKSQARKPADRRRRRSAQPPAPYAGIELGGTKCICTLAFGADAVVDQIIIPTERPGRTLAAIQEILIGWRDTDGVRALGIASFGPIDLDPTSPLYGRMLATTKSDWPGTDVRSALASPITGPVGFTTDVNGAALAELRWGCGQGLREFAYVTVGTGVGVGLIVDGNTIRGLGHSEVGHLRIPRLAGDDAPSVCAFHDDCVEGIASGTALIARLNGRPLDEVTPDDAVWEPLVHALATMCHALAVTTAPLKIAIGGGVMSRQPHLLPRIEQRLRESLNGYLELPASDYIVAPALGAMAGPLGSIAVAIDAEADSRQLERSEGRDG